MTRRSTLTRFIAMALLLTLAACSQFSDTRKPIPDKNAPRAQLSIGYSLLYQEADGIPKLKWLLLFKDKAEEMGRVTNDLVRYYRELADTMQSLSRQYPAMRIDVAATSDIEGEERKAIGADLAKDFAPLRQDGRQVRARGAAHVLQHAQRAAPSYRGDAETRNQPRPAQVLGDYQRPVGRSLRESGGVVEPPLFYPVNCAAPAFRDQRTSEPRKPTQASAITAVASNSAHVLAFGLSNAVNSYAKKLMIQLPQRDSRRLACNVDGLSYFLQEWAIGSRILRRTMPSTGCDDV
jgi:hypothetical protein